MKKLINRKGDVVKALLQNEVDFVMHCVNCQGVMGGGIAKQIKKTFPSVFKEYKTHCNQFSKKESSNLLGDVLIVDRVINIFAQNDFGVHERQLHYGSLMSCFNNLLKLFKENNSEKKVSVGIPKFMCCGLAGGSWEVVEEMLQTFPDKIEIVAYNYE